MAAEKIVAAFEYSDAEELALVKEAIVKITAFNQHYVIRGREFTRANLRELYDRERFLILRIESKTRGLSQNLLRLRHCR